nr:sucrose phosphorylase [Candidatus Pantoea persica]
MSLYDSDNALLMMKRYAPQHEEHALLCVFNLSGTRVKTMLPEARLFQYVVKRRRLMAPSRCR